MGRPASYKKRGEDAPSCREEVVWNDMGDQHSRSSLRSREMNSTTNGEEEIEGGMEPKKIEDVSN